MIFSLLKLVKIYKPDPKVYEIPVNKYKIDKSEITFKRKAWDVQAQEILVIIQFGLIEMIMYLINLI